MKKLTLLITLLLLSTVALFAKGGVDFCEGTLDEVKEKAAAEQKYLFIELYATWCPPCRIMDRTLQDEGVGEFINSRFVSARYDVDKATGALLAQTNGVRSIPTCLVLNGDGEVVGRIVGANSPDKFIAGMRRLLANASKAAEKE